VKRWKLILQLFMALGDMAVALMMLALWAIAVVSLVRGDSDDARDALVALWAMFVVLELRAIKKELEGGRR
jgi:hypothetical protein